MSEKINYAAVAFYAFLIVAAVLAVLYFLNTPVKPAFNSAWAWFSEKVHGINFGNLNIDIGKIISDNFTGIVGLGIAGVSALIGYLKIRSVTKQNDELLGQVTNLDAAKTELETVNTSLTNTITEKNSELTMYANDKTADLVYQEMLKMRSDFEGQLKAKQDTIDDLHARLTQEIANRPKTETVVVK